MDLFKTVVHLYPNAVINKDVWLQDDGDGPFIAQWKLEVPRPTEDELAAAWKLIQGQPTPTPEPSAEEKIAALQAKNAELVRRLAVAEDVANTTSENLMALMEYILNPQ